MNDVLSWLHALVFSILPLSTELPPDHYNGYVEGDYVYVSSVAGGQIRSLLVARGERVEAGEILFEIDNSQALATLRAAEARLAQAQANLANLETGGREAEIDVIRASLDRARVNLDLAEVSLGRSEQLLARDLIAPAKVDADRAAVAGAKAEVAQLEAQLVVAELPARESQQVAAEAAVRAAAAEVEVYRNQLQDRQVTAPVAGVVDNLIYEEGEVVGMGQPVITLLPEDAFLARFYVPEPERASVRIGDLFTVSCDGCATTLMATVERLAADPQFTPPIIFSRDERANLVFLVEARIDSPNGLTPGQPITVERRPHE